MRLRAGFGVFHARSGTDERPQAGFGVFHARRVTAGRLRAGYQIGGWVTSIILQCVGHIIQGRRASKKSKVKLMTISSLQRFGGGYRIRTCGAFACSAVFKTAPLSHFGNPPKLLAFRYDSFVNHC